MKQAPSLAIKLFGTEQEVEPMRTLRAGPLTAEFDQGALRFIRINGVEAIRNIAFVVRDKDWGTYNPDIRNLNIDQSATGFRVSFDAVCKDADQEFHYSAEITGDEDGSLRFSGNGTAITDFLTNRTGFVVLHPVAGVSGFPVEVEHVDGSVVQATFPDLVDPIQPFKDIRSLTHEIQPGLSVICRMEGDTFEMEDHRQWNDASYKTYVRPIGLPWPFTIAESEVLQQSVSLKLIGEPAEQNTSSADRGCQIRIGRSAAGQRQSVPGFGLGLEPQHADATLSRVELITALKPQHIVCWHDIGAGHGSKDLAKAQTLAEAVGADLILEAVLPCDDFRSEIETVAGQAQQANVHFSAVSFSPAEYLKSIMPGTAWPDVPDLADIYAAVREAFADVKIGGGMHAYFPELNRHRPPTKDIDYITHTSNTITHACDDITVTENLEALPYVIKTCRSFANGKPYRVGPSAIGMRFNPYGSQTMDNPDNQRIAMARMEPRQRGLINAAWIIGYAAHMARGGIEAITLQAAVGEFGLINHRMSWSQPWFDDSSALVYPGYFSFQGLAAAADENTELLNTESSVSHDVEALAWRSNHGTTVWLANLTEQIQNIEIDGLDEASYQCAVLDADSFEQCVTDPANFDRLQTPLHGSSVQLSAYSVVRLKSSTE